MARRTGKWLKALLFLGPLLLLSSCSFTGLAYNHLDLLVRYFLSDYVTLGPEQRPVFDATLNSVWDWHRATQMPRYAATAHAIAEEVLQPQTPEAIRARLAEVDGFGEPVVRRVLGDGAPLLSSLTDAQVTELLAAIDHKIAKEHERATRDDDAQWHRHEFKESRASFRKYAGELTPQQEARIQQYTDAQVRDPQLYYRAAVEARNRFSEQLSQRHAPDFGDKLLGMLDEHSEVSAQMETMQQASRDRFVALLADLSSSYSDAQRHHFHDQVEALARDLDELARTPRKTG